MIGKFRTLVLLFLLPLLVFVGCSPRKNVVTLRFMFWADDSTFDTMKNLVTVFEQQQQGLIKVDMVRVDAENYTLQKLEQERLAGKTPDVFILNAFDLPELRARKMLTDLSGKMDDLFDFQPRLTECFFQQNKLWAVPSNCSVLVLYYNKKKFDRAGLPYPNQGWDWSDLKQAAERLTLRDPGMGKVIQYGLDLDPGIRFWSAFVWQNSGELTDPQSQKWVLGSPQWIEKNAAALQFYADLIHQSHVAQAQSSLGRVGSKVSPFEEQSVAMVLADRKFGAALQKNEKIEWDVSSLPKNIIRATPLFVEGYGISASSKHFNEAWKLVRYLTGPTVQTKLAMTGKTVPSRVSVGQSKVFLDYPGTPSKNNRAFIDSLYYARTLPVSEKWPEIEKVIAEETDLIFSTGKVTARESLIKAQSRIDRLTAVSSVDRLEVPSQRKKF